MTYSKVFVTGIRTGLGHALAKSLLADGSEVFGISRSSPEDLMVEDRLRFRAMDLAETDEIRDGIRQLLDGVKELDLVIFNAGVLGEIKDLADTSISEIERILNVNVWANKIIYDSLLELNIQVPQIVAISSGAAVNGSGGWGGYSISKSALNLLFRVYAHEHPETHFVSLAPGLVHSQLLDYVCSLEQDERYPAIGRIRDAFGTERMQTPQQAADRLIRSLPGLLEQPTGSYVDIRTID